MVSEDYSGWMSVCVCLLESVSVLCVCLWKAIALMYIRLHKYLLNCARACVYPSVSRSVLSSRGSVLVSFSPCSTVAGIISTHGFIFLLFSLSLGICSSSSANGHDWLSMPQLFSLFLSANQERAWLGRLSQLVNFSFIQSWHSPCLLFSLFF